MKTVQNLLLCFLLLVTASIFSQTSITTNTTATTELGIPISSTTNHFLTETYTGFNISSSYTDSTGMTAFADTELVSFDLSKSCECKDSTDDNINTSYSTSNYIPLDYYNTNTNTKYKPRKQLNIVIDPDNPIKTLQDIATGKYF